MGENHENIMGYINQPFQMHGDGGSWKKHQKHQNLGKLFSDKPKHLKIDHDANMVMILVVKVPSFSPDRFGYGM